MVVVVVTTRRRENGDKGEDDDGDDEPEEEVESFPCGIPRTWMNAGFQMAIAMERGGGGKTKALGLSLRPPHEEDMAFFCHQTLMHSDTNHKRVPPPYHCRGVTALLSVVTALLYTGASVQNDHVSCYSARQPVLDLLDLVAENNNKRKEKKEANDDKSLKSTAAPYKREFEARLADALSALLRIAAQASVERKRRALELLEKSKDPADQRKWQKLERKLQLVPTCWWSTDRGSGEVRLPEGNDEDDGRTCNIQVTTSLTNVQDLRAYVVGNMKAFTSSGGCALFLETILRIHGKGAVQRMIRRARQKAGLTTKTTADNKDRTNNQSTTMVYCTCDTRHHRRMAEDKPYAQKMKAKAKKHQEGVDTSPKGHDCVSIELLSLLLTGSVHSTLQGWSTGPLGVGLLTDTPGQVSRGLTRPEKPVWILRGPTCYSVVWLDGSHDHADTFSRVDCPGQVSALTHWNCWYGERHATQLRLTADRSETIEAHHRAAAGRVVGR